MTVKTLFPLTFVLVSCMPTQQKREPTGLHLHS